MLVRLALLCPVLFACCAYPAAAETGSNPLEDGPNAEQRDPLVLWYTGPAEKWTEALPLGNGRLGAMVFGQTAEERIQLNDDTLWHGHPHDYAHPGAVEVLRQIRKLLFEGKQRDAERLAMDRFMSVPLRQMPYQPLGDLVLQVPGHDQPEEYRRWLDLDSAVAAVRYKVGDVTFTRNVFSSFPNQVIVVRIEADKPGSVTFAARLTSPHTDAETVSVAPNQLALRGRLGKYVNRRMGKEIESVLRFEARLMAKADGGKMRTSDEQIEIEGADAVTLLLAAATSFKNYQDTSADPAARCKATLAAASSNDYDLLKKQHMADHRRLFRRVRLSFAGQPSDLPTNERIKRFGEGNDPALAALYFQFGRYLLIASSRPGSQPANLQGIWNEKTSPPWESKYTVNINTEMNYWPAEVCNLAECHEPLFQMLEEVAASGRRTAKVHYGCRGWVLHHNTDLWRGTAPINNSNHGIWPTGGAWLCQHLWWHFQYSGDREFLRKRAYPVLKEAALFFVDYLVEDPRSEKKWLISGPSNSPEQGGLVMGPTMDHQIIRSLFGWVIEAGEILGVDEELRQQLTEMRARIAPNQIGQHGQLQEWLEDKDSPRNSHRHVSHLWGLHPGSEITLRGTPELAAAAKKSLEFRGDGGTGWSKAWKVNFWSRLGDGDHAYRMLSELITRSTLPNMFDTHPPFQIDGNFGGTSGIAEMLLQNHAGQIELLPALPKALHTGRVTGLRVRGNAEVDIAWKDGRAESVVLRARRDGTHRVRPPRGQRIASATTGGQPVTLKRDGQVVELDAKAGENYLLKIE